MSVGRSETDVLAANEAFYQAFNQRDMASMEALWASSAAVSCIHPGWNVLQGREAVLDSWRSILNNPGQPRIVAGGAIASVFDSIAIVICRELVATNVFIREDGAWRLLHHQSGGVYTA
jgi:hypothetical protein